MPMKPTPAMPMRTMTASPSVAVAESQCLRLLGDSFAPPERLNELSRTVLYPNKLVPSWGTRVAGPSLWL